MQKKLCISVITIDSGVHNYSVTLASLLSMASPRFLGLLFSLIFVKANCTVPLLFSRKAVICLYKWTFITLQLFLVALGFIVAFQVFNSPNFSSIEKEFGDFDKNGFEQLAHAK